MATESSVGFQLPDPVVMEPETGEYREQRIEYIKRFVVEREEFGSHQFGLYLEQMIRLLGGSRIGQQYDYHHQQESNFLRHPDKNLAVKFREGLVPKQGSFDVRLNRMFVVPNWMASPEEDQRSFSRWVDKHYLKEEFFFAAGNWPYVKRTVEYPTQAKLPTVRSVLGVDIEIVERRFHVVKDRLTPNEFNSDQVHPSELKKICLDLFEVYQKQTAGI